MKEEQVHMKDKEIIDEACGRNRLLK